ncbi:MAG: hypothetical protein GEU88_08750 [Solirubrobacterales bacterium]|nr:hypothetical protein [Solirubrobacterales bacterium]
MATVGPNDIQNDAVRARHIAAGSVHSAQLASNGIFSVDLRDGQVLGRDIRDATIRGADVADGSLGGAALKANSVTGAQVRESSLDQVPAAAVADNVLAARVSAAGTLTNVRGATTVSRPFGTGSYDVAFERSVIDCVPVVSLAGAIGIAPLAFHPDGEQGSIIRVITRDAAAEQADIAFSIVVAC